MAKKRKLKRGGFILIGIVLFLCVYFLFFWIGNKLDKRPESKTNEVETETEDTRTLMTQLKSKKDIYIGDEGKKDLSAIEIDEEYWNEIKYFFSEFSDVRIPGSYSALYSGTSDDGVRFSTDLNYFRVYTVNNEEYYKVPVAVKDEFEKIIKKSLYTSFDFAKQYKTWEKVIITSSTGESKTISKWKYDDLSDEMFLKRMVGKVQPEKSRDRSEYNFAIEIKGKDYEVRLETMGKDYMKITCNGEQSYYEVHTRLFDYIKEQIFNITE